MRRLAPVLLVAWTLLLAGCGGWYLRGAVLLPAQMDRTYVDGGSGTSAMQQALRRGLEGAGATVVESRDQATAHLRVVDAEEEQRTLAVGGDGRATEYELRFVVVFEVRDRHGDTLVPEERMMQGRELQFEADNPLGSGREAERLQDEMRQALSTAVLRRINALLSE